MQKILITRPIHQSKKLSALIRNYGGEPIIFPCIEIKPSHDPNKTKRQLQQLSQTDVAVFTSANAVHHAMPFWSQNPDLITAAIGPGTARALKQHGLTVNLNPKHFSSEGLLAMPEFQTLSHKKILIICGENSRPLLKISFEERGATVDLVTCYRRECPRLDDTTRQQLTQESFATIVSTSQENLINLNTLFGQTSGAWLHQTPLLVINSPMQTLARKLGFIAPAYLADSASDESIIKCLADNHILRSRKTKKI